MNKLIGCCIALVLILAGSASAQWNIEYQQDPAVDFHGVCFPSTTVGYAVGTGGTIYKTTDSGANWVEQTSPTTVSFFDVFFKSETEGWAVGDNGLMAYTTDGTNWSLHPQSQVLTTLDLNSIYFVGGYGWMGGDSEDIFKTTDNGTTWTLAAALGSNSEIEGISFVDTLIGYAAVDGDMTAYTTDGGTNWTLSSVNTGIFPYSRFDIEEIMMIDDTLAIATGWGSLVSAQPTIIILSEDAGVTWNICNTNYDWGTYTYGYGITMFDDGELMIVGGGTGSAGILLHSTDGGTNWSTSPAFSGEDLRDIAAVPGTSIVVAVGDGGFIARSLDKGYTWSYLGTPSWGFAGWQKLLSYGTDMYGCGDSGFISRFYSDGVGGLDIDIQTIAVDNFTSRLYDGAVFPAEGVIYVCGSYGSFYKSTDFGDTWTMLEHSYGPTDGFLGMHWFDKDNGILVGESAGNDVIYTTSDGGENLTEIWYDVTSEQFNSISFAPENPLIGVIVGDNIGIVYTTDGGANWTQATEDVVSTTDDLEEVHMVSDTDGWAVGDNGIIIKTTDGGANWTQQPSWTTSIELNDVYFQTPNHGWIAGNDGDCHYTSDGGASWIDISAAGILGLDDINAIYMQGTVGILWAGADNFYLLSEDDPAITDAETPVTIPFSLKQNYPNPFNPATTIKFSVGQRGFVSLNVYDVTGRIVSRMINREMDKGDYTVSFNAKGLSSGVYFYKLEANGNIETKKMILLR